MLTTPAVTTPEGEILAAFAAWMPLAPAQQQLKADYEAFVRAAGSVALSRDGGPEHLTGSCFVLTEDLTRVLLCFHRKGQFWVQVGGHVEPGDASVAAAGYREAGEETGIADLRPFGRAPFDLDRHPLSGSFGSCQVHWDVGFVAFADAAAMPAVSPESEAVEWFDVDQLPEPTPPRFPARLATVLAELAYRREELRGAEARSLAGGGTMPRPTTKDELLAASDEQFRALLALVDGLPADALKQEFAFEDRDRRVRDVLGHLHVWHLMMLGWYEDGMAGIPPAIPAPGHSWSTLPALNAEIWQRCQAADLPTTRAALEASHGRLQDLIRSHTDAELFTKKRYPWTGSTSLGAYFVSSTSSHYAWAAKKIRQHRRALV